MITSRQTELNGEHVAEGMPDLGDELGALVANNISRYTMNPENMIY